MSEVPLCHASFLHNIGAMAPVTGGGRFLGSETKMAFDAPNGHEQIGDFGGLGFVVFHHTSLDIRMVAKA